MCPLSGEPRIKRRKTSWPSFLYLRISYPNPKNGNMSVVWDGVHRKQVGGKKIVRKISDCSISGVECTQDGIRFHWRLSKFGSHLVSDFYLQGVDARDETATPTPEKTKSTRKADDWLKLDSKSVSVMEVCEAKGKTRRKRFRPSKKTSSSHDPASNATCALHCRCHLSVFFFKI